MKEIQVDNFKGIAPRYGQNIKPQYGITAENCDLKTGKIRPHLDHSLIEADTNDYNSMFYYNGVWERGDDKHYLEWVIGDYDNLIYLKAGVPYKKVNGTEALLGQTRLVAPTVALNGVGVLDDTFDYFVTMTRSVNGYVDESGPSTVATITAASNKVLVTAPAITDTDVTHWNIYRRSVASGDYQFVAQVAVATTTYDDNNADADLGDAPTIFYTSDQGNTITFDKPLVTFDGLADSVMNGMIFAWKGSTLYWCEPGLMDAWPAYYSLNFPSAIKRCIRMGGVMAVLTEDGPFKVEGSNPELLDQSDSLGKEPCIGTAAVATRAGVAYLSDSGIALFNLLETSMLTDSKFDEEYFANITTSTAVLAENDGQLYLFHDAGALVGDFRTQAQNWSTLSIQATAAHKRPDNGKLYAISSDGVEELHGATTDLEWTFESGDLLFRTEDEKKFIGIEVIGSGSVTAYVYVDSILKKTKALSFDMARDRSANLPEETFGRAMTYKLIGTGNVDAVIAKAE